MSTTTNTRASQQPTDFVPVPTDAQRAAALAGIRYLNNLNRDGAEERNGVGFNRLDTSIGRSLAAFARLSDRQVQLATKILFKYRNTQLPPEIVCVLWSAKDSL